MAITTANLAKKFIPLLDEVYKNASVTADLVSPPEMVQAGANARSIKIPKLEMDGLANYSRSAGYVGGDVSVSWQEVEFNYDRGRKFNVDAMDDEETFNVAFGRLSAEFVRTKVAPEADAFTFSKIVSRAATGNVAADGAFANGTTALASIRTAMTALDEAEVPPEERILYILPGIRGMIDDLDTTKSRAVMDSFYSVVTVPQSRFYSAIVLKSGGTGEEAGSYGAPSGALKLNFMVVHKPAIIKFDKHVINSVIEPEQNQTHDGWLVKYRKYGLVDIHDNKQKGVYVSTGAAIA